MLPCFCSPALLVTLGCSVQAGVGLLGRLTGSWMPFARSRSKREPVGDPRPSVRERYPTRPDYISKITAVALDLRRRCHLLLDEDVIRILEKAQQHELWSR